MTDDIVTRLRLRPTILRKNQFGDMETDRAATALFDDCHAIMREAADEIERLRLDKEKCHDIMETQSHEIHRLVRNTGCARNQGTTQFCAEALDAQRDVETLKAEIVKNADEFRETLTELRQRVETLTAERDGARRMVCMTQSALLGGQMKKHAENQGWDCFDVGVIDGKP